MATNFKSLKELLNKYMPWFERLVVDARASGDAAGRPGLLKALGHTETLKLEDLRKVTNREELNAEFSTKFLDESGVTGPGTGGIKTEITALYSFNKCLVQRYKGRMHHYRDDMSQRRKRNTVAVAQAAGKLAEFSKNLA